jgi:hypothetical protein
VSVAEPANPVGGVYVTVVPVNVAVPWSGTLIEVTARVPPGSVSLVSTSTTIGRW